LYGNDAISTTRKASNPRICRLLLLGRTHHDVGYTIGRRIVDGMHAGIVREVLRPATEDTARAAGDSGARRVTGG